MVSIVRARWLAATLAVMLVVEAGAIAPAFVLADEPISTPPAAQSAPPSPEPVPTASPESPPTFAPTPTPAPAPSIEPTPAATPPPNPTPEVTPGIEVPDMRTADSQTFQQSDGSFVTEFYTEARFYQPEGQTDWLPIDTRFVPVADGDVSARITDSPAQISVSSAAAENGFLTLNGRGHAISFGLPDDVAAGSSAAPQVMDSGGFVEYTDFLAGGIGLRIFPRADGFKGFLVLPAHPLINTVTFAINAPGLTLTAEEDGTLAFHDAQGIVVGHIPRPFLMDSSQVEGFGGGTYSEAVTMSLAADGPGYLLTLTVDPEYLARAVYPVYLDPTVDDFPQSGTTALDTFASERYPNSNFNTYARPDSPYYSEMWHGYEPGYGKYDEVFIWFKDLRSVLAPGHIDEALLEFYPYWQYYHYQYKPSQMKLLTGTWAAGSVTWNSRPPGYNGAEYMSFDTHEDVWSDTDITDWTQEVVNYDRDNYGFMIHADDYGQGSWKRIVSLNDSHTPDRTPYLTVTWHRPAATPSAPVSGAPNGRTLAWTYDAGDATDGTPQSHYWIQVATSSAFGTGTVLRETTNGGTPPSTWATGDATSWTFPSTGTTITEGTTYYWRIKVKDGHGESNWSSAASFVYIADARRGEEAYYGRVPFDLGGGWRMAVGAHNGELTLDRYLFEVPSYGPSQGLFLSYSSLNTASAYLGAGWSSNLTQHLSFATNVVYWNRADGGVVPFVQVGGTWTPIMGHFETLTAGTGEYTVTLKDQTALVFESSGSGRLKRVTNRFGKSLTLSWSTGSATATDASARVTNIAIGGGLISSVTDSAGRAWQFGYTSGKLTTLTDPLGAVTTFAYGSSGVTSVTRSRSRVTGSPETITWSVAYASGLVSSVSDPINSSVANTFTYTAGQTTVGLLKEYAGPVRNTWIYAFDNYGRVTSTLDPEGYTTAYTLDSSSNLTKLVLPIEIAGDSQAINYTHDSRGNVVTQTTQLSATQSVVTAMSYNSTNDLLARSEAEASGDQTVTKYTYSSGHLASVNVNCTTSTTAPPSPGTSCTGAGTQDTSTNLITTYSYTANGQLETETDPLGRVTKHVYDTHGNETEAFQNCTSSGTTPPTPPSSCSALGTRDAQTNVSTSYVYDSGTVAGLAGLPTSATDPVDNTTEYEYDNLGNQTAEELPGDDSTPAVTRSTTYDELGNVLTDSDVWDAVERITEHVYDKANRETLVTDPADVETSNEYDAAGNAVESTAGGVTASREYDGLGNVVEEGVGSDTTLHSYDGQRRDVVTTDPEDVTIARQYDLAGRLLSETVAAEDGDLTASFEYDLLFRQTGSTSPDGTTSTTEYDHAGRTVESVKAGATTSHSFDRVGNETSTANPDSTTTTSSYDALNRLTQIIANDVLTPLDPTEDVSTTTYYDAAGRAAAFTDGSGISSRSVYNVRGMLSQAIANCTDSGTTPTADPTNCTGTGTHDATANIVTTTTYDGLGAVTVAVTAEGTGDETTIEYAYDAAGRQQAFRDSVNTVTRTIYDADGRVTHTIVNCTDDTTDPEPPSGSWWTCVGSALHDGTWNVTTARTYDAHGNVASETAPNGRVTTYVFDDADRLIQRIDNDSAGTPSADDQDISTFYAYDDAGRQVAVRTPTADRSTFAVTRNVYDGQGHLVAEIRNCTDSGTTPLGDPAWRTCSGDGSRDADTNIVTEYGFDERGNRVLIVAPDPSDISGDATVNTRYAYDSQDRLCGVLENATEQLATLDPCATSPSSTGPDEDIWTSYSYDGLGNLVSMTDGEGHQTLYGYDELGRMVSVTDADGGTTTYGYDPLGRRVSQSERGTGTMATLVTWTYDAAGRTHERITGDGTTTYEYDLNGNLESVTAGDSQITTSYDRLNRPLTVTVGGDGAATTNYTYDLESPTWTDPSGEYAAYLDAFGRQVELADPIHDSASFGWTYRADGQPVSAHSPNGNSTSFSYDDVGRATAKVTTRDNHGIWLTPAAYVWSYNRAGQILSEDSTIDGDPTNGTTTFEYDQLSRLTSHTHDSSTTAYGWQKVANREAVQVDSDPAVTYDFDAANRETTSSLGDIAYDVEGRLTARPGQSLEWNDLGQLTAVHDASTSGLIAAYAYDALDRLLTVDHDGDVIRFRYVGLTTQVAQVIDDTTESVNYSVAHDWSGEPLFQWDGPNESFYGTNAHHDVTWTADLAGQITSALRYDPWGILEASAGSDLPTFRFQGSWFDQLADLSWAVARWYAPGLGRFISQDSYLGTQADPSSRNQYAYGEGDPVNRWDADGRFWYKVINFLGRTPTELSLQFYGNTSQWWVIRAGNPGITTPVNFYAAPRAKLGECVWIPYLPHTNQCETDRHDSSLIGTRLTATYDAIIGYMTEQMKTNAADGAGGVGTWQNPSWFCTLWQPCRDATAQNNAAVAGAFLIREWPKKNCAWWMGSACGSWDHKPILQTNFYRPGEAFWTAVRGHPVPESLRFDVWSNIHFGYVGRAHGIPESVLWEGNKWFGGGNPSDNHAIEIGIRLWNQFGRNLNETILASTVQREMGQFRYEGRAVIPRLVVVGTLQ